MGSVWRILIKWYVCYLHFFRVGFSEKDAVNFTLEANNPEEALAHRYFT